MRQTNTEEILVEREVEFERPVAGLLAGIFGAILGTIFFVLASILSGSPNIIIYGLVGYFIAIVVRNHGRGKHIFFPLVAVTCTVASCIMGLFIVYIYAVYLAASQKKVGLILNFAEQRLVDGVKRIVL